MMNKLGNYDIEPLDLKPYRLEVNKPKKRSKMKKLLGALKRTISGENKTGELVHGVLDIFPIPNQIIAKGAKALLGGNKEVARQEFKKLNTVRNWAALVASVLILTGVVGIEEVKAVLEMLTELGVL